ncbi:uncharacterized protein BP01DRAFT_356442 [Aspergillus saccharolyticus JOP 1030-1]|uniref:Uncharacterized protein n=1 Tax=Aspergillus saccharolyticus JOP 1030-1 TaxID=1450539 RepID=A0A318ZFE8_9EURO|nr:hypothetical protein BP01DRAFT_356442 [Aspergillus saccharolyticus JOP 1030-1]PYH45805.1 hypothetical protein BP01DRAFT_356442 [Aspergillus saccharolyticus JOP 1030-1]
MPSSIQATTKPLDTSKRRRFQPPITNYFTSSPSSFSSFSSHNNNDDHPHNQTPHQTYNHYSTSTSSPTPTLAPKYQSSLLSVGMRIRKAIAEGYKTHATSLPSLEKPGVYRPSPTRDITNDEGDAFSLPASSQDSSTSSDSAMDVNVHMWSGKKRGFADVEVDVELGCGETGYYAHHSGTTPSSDSEMEDLIPSSGHMLATTTTLAGRTILAPRARNLAGSSTNIRRRFGRGTVPSPPLPPPHSTSSLASAAGFDVDFEEPAFLRSREEAEGEGWFYGREVEMGM